MSDELLQEQGESAAATDPAPPEPPRPVTPRARSGSWTEPRVRAWWLAAAGVLIVCLYFLTSRYLQWRKDMVLIRDGQPIEAYVYSADGYPIPGRRRPPTSPVELHYEVGGKKYQVQGYLTGRKDSFVVHTNVPIRVDPDNPARFTAREEPTSLTLQLVGGLILLPFTALLAIVAFVQRARLLALWRNGRTLDAIVLDARHTALAPRSWLVRCAPADPEDKRVLSVYVPGRAQPPARGEGLWLVADTGGKPHAVASGWMQ
jgi:hypothetical protein